MYGILAPDVPSYSPATAINTCREHVTASDIVDKFVIVAFDVNLAPSGGKKDASYREEIKQRFTKGLAFCKSQRSAES